MSYYAKEFIWIYVRLQHDSHCIRLLIIIIEFICNDNLAIIEEFWYRWNIIQTFTRHYSYAHAYFLKIYN